MQAHRFISSSLNSSTLEIARFFGEPPVVDFDWGFDVDIPWQRLSIFTRHIDTGAAIERVPVFALATFTLTSASSEALQNAQADIQIKFPALPLGVIGTDHVGYGSFDLSPLQSFSVLQSLRDALSAKGLLRSRDQQPRLTVNLSQLLVLPYKDFSIAFDALTEGDLGPDFICLRMDLDTVMLANREVWPPMPAMQTPSIDDWRMSPGSFSMSGALLIGEDGCETLLPANLATKMVRFRQLVRTPSQAEAGSGRDRWLALAVPSFSGIMRLGYSVAYQSEWFPVGHSLGQISYSLPLAPGEKIKIAVVDWSRHDAAKRTEQTTEKEDLQHAALRDRSLTEAVQMVVQESQSGSSFMAGGALSAAAGIPIGAASLGIGQSFGLGGASANSDGVRSTIGDTTQQISDAFHQASSAQRELNSTVVIQADQTEVADARTRVVANYNHSHALTILYYEVLQHHRLVTKATGVRPAMFLKHEVIPFDTSVSDDPDYALIQRYMIEIAANLLDESLRGCLDIVKKWACLKLNFDREKAKRAAQGVPSDDYELGDFSFWVLSGNVGPEMNINVRIIPKAGGTPIDCVFADLSMVATAPFSNPPVPIPTILENSVSPRIRPNEEFLTTLRPTQKVRWGNVAAIEVGQTILPSTKVEFNNGQSPADWIVQKMKFATQEGSDKWTMFDGVPTPANVKWDGSTRADAVAFKPPLTSVDDLLTDDERCCLQQLVNHLNTHAGYYWKAIWLAESPSDRAVRLDKWHVGNVPLLDLIENKLLDVDGEYLVLPIVAGAQAVLDKAFQTKNLGLSTTPYLEFVEQLLTIPSRGVFAEAKLGNCNSSELIDPSRFWDWQTSPIPDDAPAIAPTSTDSRYQDPTKGLTPTAFPTPIVNIVNPQTLPNPTGLNDAAAVLSALGPFRDMSGIKELSSYLQSLANYATQLASQGLKEAQPQPTQQQPTQQQPTQQQPTQQQPTQQQPTQQQPTQQQPTQQQPTQQQPTQQQQPIPQPQKPTVLSPKTRRLTFTFLFDLGQEMWGTYQVELLDTQTMHSYIPAGDQTPTNILFIDLPASVKAGVIVRVQGTVSPRRIEAPSDIDPQSWSLNIQTTAQFGSMDGVTGFNIIGQTKKEELGLTIETDKETTKTNTDSTEWGFTLTSKGTLELVELGGEGVYKVTKTSDVTNTEGDKTVRTIKLDMYMLDKQKQPLIVAVK